MSEASNRTQVLVTSHSPDLLDSSDIPIESLLAVDNREGRTRIGPVDEAGRNVLRERLFTPGELLRQQQLIPAASTIEDVQYEHQLGLFELDGTD